MNDHFEIKIYSKPKGEMTTFYVEDNGPGIDDRLKDNIFLIFNQLATSTSNDNTGMGLALCKSIVELHNGEIWVSDNPVGGSIFTFTLPKV